MLANNAHHRLRRIVIAAPLLQQHCRSARAAFHWQAKWSSRSERKCNSFFATNSNSSSNKSRYWLLPTTATLGFLFFSTNPFASPNRNNNNNNKIFPGTKFTVAAGAFCAAKSLGAVPAAKAVFEPCGCGEDSWCIEGQQRRGGGETNDSGDVVLMAVADGVGGWRNSGVNPADFSQNLMQNTRNALLAPEDQDSATASPKELLKDAFRRLVKDWQEGRAEPFGSSTACVVLIDRERGQLECANLGDSGVIVLGLDRKEVMKGEFNTDSSGISHSTSSSSSVSVSASASVQSTSAQSTSTSAQSTQSTQSAQSAQSTHPTPTQSTNLQYKIKFKSTIQQHRFNCPYQLTLTPPPKVTIKDVSDLADCATVPLEHGDIVLVVTDGVLDNLFPEQMEQIVGQVMSNTPDIQQNPSLLARRIGEEAYKNSKNEQWASPFAMEARRHGRNGYIGGKTDDITVLAAIIT